MLEQELYQVLEVEENVVVEDKSEVGKGVELVVVEELLGCSWRMIKLVDVVVVEGTAWVDFGHNWDSMKLLVLGLGDVQPSV